MLDTDREPDQTRSDTKLRLVFGPDSRVGKRRRVLGQRLGASQRHRQVDQAEGVEE